jgi:hypothetical protein
MPNTITRADHDTIIKGHVRPVMMAAQWTVTSGAVIDQQFVL